MTLRQIEILRALIRHRTTMATGQKLALSQPTISNALRTMEAQAGFPLFHRINNRLFPTASTCVATKGSWKHCPAAPPSLASPWASHVGQASATAPCTPEGWRA